MKYNPRAAIGRPKDRNYPILSSDAYRAGWERIWGQVPKGTCGCYLGNDVSITTHAVYNCPEHGAQEALD